MKAAFLTLILSASMLCFAQAPAGNEKPLTQNQILALLKAGMESEVLAKTVQERGIDFEPSDADMEALLKAGAADVLITALRASRPKPLTREQVLQFVVAGMPSARAMELVNQFGVDFVPDEEYLGALFVAGAEEALVAAVRSAGEKAMARLRVVTSPDAEVYLDGDLKGRASSQGELAIKVPAGTRTLKVSLAGKQDIELTISLARGRDNEVDAPLVDLPGTLRFRTAPGASVSLDGYVRGSADASGELVLTGIPSGSHEVRVTALDKEERRQTVMVIGGKATVVEVKLAELPGALMIQTLPGARISLDGIDRGDADAAGMLVLADLAPGPHEVRVAAPRKKDFRQTATVLAGSDVRIEASLQDAPPTVGELRENPKDGLKYAWVPPGSFMMGADKDGGDERPVHRVTLSKGFWMGQTEVTAGAYKRFAAATQKSMPRSAKFNPGSTNEQLPIVNVSWDEAAKYCAWAGGRLPTEAEWEYAARAGSAAATYGPLGEIAWHEKNSGGRAQPVAQKRANGFSLYDLLGNVREWVSDWYAGSYYSHSPERDPQGPERGSERVPRGGSWVNVPGDIRASIRDRNSPDDRHEYVGFRCALIQGGL